MDALWRRMGPREKEPTFLQEGWGAGPCYKYVLPRNILDGWLDDLFCSVFIVDVGTDSSDDMYV